MNLLVAITVALLIPAAHAASFDCAKASSRVEKAICAEPALGKLDDAVAAAYTRARAGLPEPWRPRLLRSQREWLALRSSASDLAAELRQRLGILQGMRVSVGGVPFLKLSDDARPMYVLAESPGARAYNQWVDSVWLVAVGQSSRLPAGTPACPSGEQADCTAETTARTYVTSVPSPALLSVGETIVTDEQGAAHPEVEWRHHDWWLSRAGRVTAQDMFVGSGWRPVIDRAARAYARSQNDRVEVDAAAVDGVSTVDAWKLTSTALVLAVDGYAFNLGRGMAEVEIPWRSFGASLRPEFAAALGLH